MVKKAMWVEGKIERCVQQDCSKVDQQRGWCLYAGSYGPVEDIEACLVAEKFRLPRTDEPAAFLLTK